MKRFAFVGCAVAVLLICLTVAPASAQSGYGKCKALYIDWDAYGNFAGPYYLWFDNDGSVYESGLYTADWYVFNGSYSMMVQGGCYPLYSGKKSSGFMQCTDGTETGVYPGIYIIKSAKKGYCGFFAGDAVTKQQGGPSLASPR